MAFSSLFTKDKSTETEENVKKENKAYSIHILPLRIVNPVQTINTINSKKDNK